MIQAMITVIPSPSGFFIQGGLSLHFEAAPQPLIVPDHFSGLVIANYKVTVLLFQALEVR